jgi:acyl carrier protein
MDRITLLLTNCFQTVFPGLPEAEIPAASQASIAAWDSVAAITLMNVIEEEFGIQMDFDQLADLDSFGRIHDYLSRETQAS